MSGGPKIRKELTLREKVQLIHQSEGKSHRALAQEFNIGKTQVSFFLTASILIKCLTKWKTQHIVN